MTDVLRTMIDRILERVNAISGPGPGYTRPSYSDLETAAHRVIEEEAAALGLEVRHDAAGNLFAHLPGAGRNAVPLHMGSHLDTVSNGGAYDGPAGVAGAMALAASLVADGITLPFDFVVTVTRAEESVWFPASYIGSRAALGALTQEDLGVRRSDTERTLAEHMREQGFAPEDVLRVPVADPGRFLEMHIEQGPVLESAGEPYGIVYGVRGGLRYRSAQLHGIWAHSGGAPRESRADTVFALADLVNALDLAWEDTLTAGDDLAITLGRVDAVSPVHAMAKVPGHLGFCLDMRLSNVAVLERMNRILNDCIGQIEARRASIRFELGAQSRSAPAMLSERMAGCLSRAAGARGFQPRRMLSGGGHDAAAFATAGWESVMIFIRNWNGSHCPEEGMDPDDLAAAVHLVKTAALCEARSE